MKSCAALLVVLAAAVAAAAAAAEPAPAQLRAEQLAAARLLLQEGDGKRATQGAPAPQGSPQGGMGQKQGGGNQGGGGGKGNSGPKIAASLSDWIDNTMSNDGWLTMSFVVAWFAAPGVALLLWPYVVDTAVSIAGVAKACKARTKAAA